MGKTFINHKKINILALNLKEEKRFVYLFVNQLYTIMDPIFI